MSVVSPQRIAVPGSLKSLMDGLVEVQAALPGSPMVAGFEPLSLYRWRPPSPDLPALWNVLMPSSSEPHSTAGIRDYFRVNTRIGDRYADTEDHMPEVEAWADAYRQLIDSNLWAPGEVPLPLKSFANWGMRVSLQTFGEEFSGGIFAFGVEFVTEFWVIRIV